MKKCFTSLREEPLGYFFILGVGGQTLNCKTAIGYKQKQLSAWSLPLKKDAEKGLVLATDLHENCGFNGDADSADWQDFYELPFNFDALVKNIWDG